MEAVLSRLLLLLLLCALAAAAGPTPGHRGPVPVQKPFNLMKTSYNFNTTLNWNYSITSVTPYFQVECRNYRNVGWSVVETCWNISHSYCDLSDVIVDPYRHYSVRVKAFVGSEMSDYEKTEFYLINDGIIGPPTLNASVDGVYINVDVWHPPVGGKKNVGDYLTDLSYDIYYGNETEETDECDAFGCSIKILLTNQTKYCFSAQGKSDTVPMTMEKSKEICISTNVTNGIPIIVFVIIGIVAAVMILLVLSYFIIKRKIAAKPLLPVSLNNFAKVVTTRMNLPTGQVTKYDPVSVSPIESVKMTPEETEVELNVPDDPDIGESIDNGYHSSVGEAEQRTDEEPSSSSKYYRTENSDSSIDSTMDDDVTKQEPLTDVRPATNSYGYDKPHCPL